MHNNTRVNTFILLLCVLFRPDHCSSVHCNDTLCTVFYLKHCNGVNPLQGKKIKNKKKDRKLPAYKHHCKNQSQHRRETQWLPGSAVVTSGK